MIAKRLVVSVASAFFWAGPICGFQLHSDYAWAQTADPAADILSDEEDPFEEDDPLAVSGNTEDTNEMDPFSQEDDSDLSFMETESVSMEMEAEQNKTPTYTLRTTIDQSVAIILAYAEDDTGGITQDEETDLDTNNYASYQYQTRIKIQTTPFRYYYLRVISSFTQKYNHEDEQHTDDYVFQLREGYINDQFGQIRYRAGAQIFKTGSVDFDSPLDVLNMKNPTMADLLEVSDSKDPTVALKADWLGEYQIFSFYLSPFRQKTAGTEYTIFQEETEEKERGEDLEDRSVIRSHFGLAYQLSMDSFDIRIGGFQWFDQDNTISWQDLSTASGSADATNDYSQSYEESDSTVQFVFLELDATLGGIVFKLDVGYFHDKNVYDYFKKDDGSSYFNTKQVKHAAAAFSIEKKFEYVFIMPVYSYRIIYDVPADTHILFYENEEEPLAEERDLEKRQLSLVLAWELTDNLQLNLIGSSTSPFKQDGITTIWTYKSFNNNHMIEFKLHYSTTEKIKMTGNNAQTKRSAVKYTYKF